MDSRAKEYIKFLYIYIRVVIWNINMVDVLNIIWYIDIVVVILCENFKYMNMYVYNCIVMR